MGGVELEKDSMGPHEGSQTTIEVVAAAPNPRYDDDFIDTRLLDISIAAPYSAAEHLTRVAKWTKSIKPQAEIEFESDFKQEQASLIIDEGVKRLETWDRAIVLNERAKAAKRMHLIAELRKIKTTVDPDDTITPRIVVQEFQKYYQSKKLAPQSKYARPPSPILQKKVQFNPQNESLSPKETTNKPVMGDLNVGFTVSYPPAKLITIRKNFNAKVGAIPRPHTFDVPKYEQLSKQDKGPEWWRRKIRQGMIETDELMTRLVKQRKEEETFHHLKNGAEFENYGYEPSRPTTFNSIAARITRLENRKLDRSLERQRLDRSLERIKRQHIECFGIPAKLHEVSKRYNQSNDGLSNFDDYSEYEAIKFEKEKNSPKMSRRASIKSKTEANKNSESQTLKKAEVSSPDASEIQENRPRSKSHHSRSKSKKQTSTSLIVKKVDPSSNKKSKDNTEEDIQVIYARRTGTADTLADAEDLDFTSDHTDYNFWKRDHTNNQTGFRVSPLKAVTGRGHPAVIEGYTKTKLPQKSRELKDPIAMLKKPTGNPREWVQRLNDAKKKNEIKNETETKNMLAKQKAKTNALYQEILMNKARLHNEVDVEKKKIQSAWRLDMQKASERHKLQKSMYQRSESEQRKQAKTESKKIHGNKTQRVKYKDLNEDTHPRGLSTWLEGVINKAHNEKLAREK